MGLPWLILYNNYYPFLMRVAYCFKNETEVEYPNGESIFTKQYNLYNYRHRNIGTMSYRYQLDNVGNKQVMDLTWDIVAWAYESVNNPFSGTFDPQNVLEHRLPLERLGYFAFQDFVVATTKMRLASVAGQPWNMVITNTEEEHFEYNTTSGFLRKITQLKRQQHASLLQPLIYIINIENTLDARVERFDGTYIEINFKNHIENSMAVSEQTQKLHTYLDPNRYRIDSFTRAAANGEESDAVVNSAEEMVSGNLQRLTRVQSLDTSMWHEINFTDDAEAAMCRDVGLPFNNAYLNLLTDETGFQQIVSAVEADFVEMWTVNNNINFADIKTLRAKVLEYNNIRAALLCRDYKIRYRYLGYVGAIIAYLELLRGVTSPVFDFPSVHVDNPSKYPFYAIISANHENYLAQIMEYIGQDVSANNTPAELRDYYDSFVVYNQWMSGQATTGTTTYSFNIRKLGLSYAEAAGVLNWYLQYLVRFAVALIDRELTQSYLSDPSFTGSVNMSDPANNLKPGDLIGINFGHVNDFKCRVIGSTLALSPGSVQQVLELKQNFPLVGY